MTIMSGEEDTELRDLVAQTLESNGVLGKIRVNLISVTCCSNFDIKYRVETTHKFRFSFWSCF